MLMEAMACLLVLGLPCLVISSRPTIDASTRSLLVDSSSSPAPTPVVEDYHVAAPEGDSEVDILSPCRCLSSEELPFEKIPISGTGDTEPSIAKWEILLKYPRGEMTKHSGKRGKPGEFTRSSLWGTYCAKHDEYTYPLCDNDEMMKQPDKLWCHRPWCYVSPGCACGAAAYDKSAKMTLRHAIRVPLEMLSAESREAYDTVYQSYQNCDADEIAKIGTSEDDSLCDREPQKCQDAQEQCFKDASRRKEIYMARQAKEDAKQGDSATINVDIDIPQSLKTHPISISMNGQNVFSIGGEEVKVATAPDTSPKDNVPEHESEGGR